MNIYLVVDSNYLKVGGIFYLGKNPAYPAKVINANNDKNFTTTNSNGHFLLRFSKRDDRDEVQLKLESKMKNVDNIRIHMSDTDYKQSF
jgi:hypothetical protein